MLVTSLNPVSFHSVLPVFMSMLPNFLCFVITFVADSIPENWLRQCCCGCQESAQGGKYSEGIILSPCPCNSLLYSVCLVSGDTH
jgi:hypothetical protein